jgi:hypothetical protein
MTDAATKRKSGTKRTRRAPVERHYRVTMGTRKGGFKFKALISISGQAASSANLIDAMPLGDVIWPEARRKECLEKIIALCEFKGGDDITDRACEAYLAMLSVLMELSDAKAVERARAKPKPELRVVGGYESQ